MYLVAVALLSSALQTTQLAMASLIVPQNFTVPGMFPTSVFSHYYNNPTATSSQVQPIISDPVTVAYHRVVRPNMLSPDAA